MLEITFAQLAELLKTNPMAIDQCCRGVNIDTRQLQPNNLFIALPGTQVDGHDFIPMAYQKHAAAAIVTRLVDSPLPQFVVTDPVKALGQIALTWRKQFHLPVIAVTGSNGKTTLKNMIASILTAACTHAHEVLATEGTLNNHLGLPLTLSKLNAHHRYAVLEMGMNHAGEIDYLTQLALPDVAVITNAAESHLEGLHSVENIARAKAEIFNGLSPTGTAILNRDDTFYDYWQTQVLSHRQLSFGLHPAADIRLEGNIFHTPKGSISIRLPLLGQHNILNALAAAASTLAIGIELDKIKTGLENVLPARGRLQLHTLNNLNNLINVIDDTYNANPFSLKAALQVLADFNGQKILILGDMKELGKEAVSLHKTAGSHIRKAGIHRLFTYGELSAHASQSFGEGAEHFDDQTQLINALKPFLQQHTTILVKGSRSMKMEKIVTELIQTGSIN